MRNLVFNGQDFSELFVIGRISQPIATRRARTVEVGSRSVLNGVELASFEIAVDLHVTGKTNYERREAFRTLAMWLDVDGERPLSVSDDSNLYYMAVPNGDCSYNRFINAASTTVRFLVTDPVAYGTERTITVPSGGSVTFTVNGTYPTKPTIAAEAVRNSTSLVWGLKIDNSEFVHVPTGSASAVPVALDCNNRTSTVSGSVKLPTLDSDWLEFAPGTHTLAMDYGTGAATVTYRERWL